MKPLRKLVYTFLPPKDKTLSCAHKHWHKDGKVWSGTKKVQCYRCSVCGKTTTKDREEEEA